MEIFAFHRDEELLHSIESSNLKKVKQFLNSGIDVNSVLHSHTHLEGATILALAAFHGQDIIVQHLLDRRALVNFHEPCRKKTALHWACRGGHYKSVRKLLERGANVNSYDRDNETPIMCAVKYTKTAKDIVHLLIEYGANVQCCDRLHTSPLHYASFRGHLDVVDMLIKAGSISNYKTMLGDGTPLANLISHDADSSCILLLAAGYNLKNDRSHNWVDNRPGDFLPVRKVLMHELRNPPLLTRICRMQIRNQLGGYFLERKIRMLPLPPRLIDYLTLNIV